MASKPINPQPLQMPNLSQLPDPMKDLMGGTGLTNPTSLMTMNQQGINDLFAPKPIDGNFIKPSAEAAKALQTAEQQAQTQTDEVAKLQQQQLEIIEKQKREAERQAQENMKLAEQMRKEREKALKEKKEQQGGKLGAAPDGSFVLAQDAKALIAHSDWKAIVSDMQRNDQMNNWLKEAGDALRKQGIAEDVIKAELEHAKKIISDDTRQYVNGMREDGTDLHDLGLSVVKGLAPISNLIGAGVGWLGFDNAASNLHQFGTDLSNAMDEAKSKTMQLDKANNDYLNQKSAELNPNRGWFERADDSLANIHKSGNKFSTAVDLVGVAIPALLTGGGTALTTQGAGRATIAYAGRFAQGGLVNKGLTFAGNQITKHGASVTTVAAFGGGDAAQSAWDGVMNASFDNIKSGYIRAYGETDWNALVKEHNGDEEAIKRDIANNSAEKAVAAFVPMAILAAPLGLESMVARTVAGKSNAVAGSKLLAIGTAGISEGIEEGLTTFAGNYGQHGGGTLGAGSSITGTTLDAGVPEAAAIGMVAGVGLSAPMTMYDAAQAKRNNFSVKNIDVNSYVTDGNLNQQLFEQEVMRAFYAEKRSALNQGMSEAQANAYLQLQFNQYIDNEHTRNAMHPDMHAEFKKKMETEFDISNNNYTLYQDTAVAKAFASGDINQVKALNDVHALNAFRMARGVETNLVPKDGQVYYQALADVMTHLENSDKNVNTKGRHAQYVSHTNSENSSFQQFKEKLSRDDLASIDQYVMTVLDAGQRRLTDQQQQQYNAAQQAAQTVQQQRAQATTTQNNPQGTNNGTNQQTNQNQSAGQGTATQNAGPVPSQSGGDVGTNQPTTDNQTQVGADNTGGATANPTQSGGDGITGQGTNASPATDPAVQNSAGFGGNSQGAGQAPNIGNTVNPTTPTNVGGQATQSGITGQASQSGQPIGPTGPSTTQATTGGGSVGTPQTERYSNGGSNQAPTKASIEKSLFENGAEISDTDIQLIVNDLPSNLKKSLAYSELRDNITIPSDKVLSDYSVAQALAALPNEQFNAIFVPALGAKSTRTGRGKTIRSTYNAIIKSYANLLYDRQAAQYRTEQDARQQAEREQNAQARTEDQARLQQTRAEQKAETDRIKAGQKAQREDEKEQARLDKQAERERQAQEKAQAREQKKIDDADVANTKAQQALRDKQEILREKELVHIELTDSRAELVSQLDEAKLTQKESKETVREYEKRVKNANTAVDKADKAWRKELEKTKRKELKEQWTVEKKAATTIKNELTKAIKALEVADKSVNDLNKKIKALDVKIKKAKQVVTVDNREVVSARTAADKTQAKLDALRGVQADEQSTTDTNADNGSQDVGETDVADIAESQVEQELNPNLPAVADQPQRNKRMRIEMTSTGRPTILMGMESTGLLTIELGYTIYLDYIPEQHKAEVRQDLMSDIPNDADIVGIVRELADIVGVTYDTMLDKLATNADNLNQNEYDGLASLLDTILIDLYGETNEQTDTSSNSESSETTGETQRSEQGTARQTQRNAEPTTLPAVLGFRALEVASRELTPLINTPVTDLTLADFTALVETISQATSLPTEVVANDLVGERLLLEAPQGNILDFVYDEISNVWVWASEYNPPQRGQLNATQQTEIGYEQTPSREQGNRSLNAPNRAGTPALAEPAERVQEPIQLGTTQTGLGTIELGFNNPTEQEQTNATQNDLGQSVQPTQERTQDDNEIIRERTGNESTNDGQGEILGQSRQPISEQSRGSGVETTQDTEQLGVETPAQFDGTPQLLTGTTDDKVVGRAFINSKGLNKTAILSLIDGKPNPSKLADLLTSEQSNLTQEQAQALVQFARTVRSGEFNQNYADYLTATSNAEQQQIDNNAGLSEIDRWLKDNPNDKEVIEKYLRQGREKLTDEYVALQERNAPRSDLDRIANEQAAIPKTAHDFIAEKLADQAFTNAFAREQVSKISGQINDTYTAQTNGIDTEVRSMRGGSMGNEGGYIDPDLLFALPKSVFNILKKVWNAIKKNVAVVSMALAITTGTTFAIPTEANAATPTETAVVQNIVSQNDNQGKQFIVADKQAGTLTLYTPQGQQITSTPALFGKATGDRISTNNATPSGRYDMNFVDGARIEGVGYGSSAQALSVNGRLQENNAGNLAIHRVLPVDNRQAKLDSATATDNRISHGCINVPSSFYDTHLDRQQDTVVYVMPETDAGKTGVFATQVEQVPQAETTTPAVYKTTPVANVAKEMDNANGQSVEVSAEQITNATPHSEIKQSPVVASAPTKIANTTPSGQIANVTPTVVGGVTITQIDVPFKVATPAEMQANGVFDTDPISGKERTDDGLSAYDVVLGILGAYGAGAIAVGVGKRRKNLASKQAKADESGDSTPPNDVSSGSMSDGQAQETVDTNHNQQAQANQQANGTSHVQTHVQAPPQKTALADAISREMWVNYMNTQSHNARFTKNGQVTFLDDLTENLDLLGYTYDVVMSDPTYEQINNGTLNDGRKWKFTDPTNRKRTGVSATMMNFMAGVTQNFDNLMHKYGIARGGHEADSSLPSIHLSQVRSKASGAYAQIHKLFVKPLFRKIDNLAVELKVGIVGLEADIGRVSTLRHILNEGADALWRSKENLIAERQTQLAAIQAELARTPSGQQYSKTLTDKSDMLTKEITQLQEALDDARDMYEGRKTWDGKTKLPGGYTKARVEKDLADIKAKYGSDFSKVENLAKETAQTVLHIRQFATASGVFTNADLDAFNEIGFQEYVPLYKEQKDNRIPDETDNETQTSIMDRLTADIPTQQAKAMGLTKDLSRYAREGATEIAADGITNLKLFSMNMAGRIGQQQWLQSVQQLYEGNVGRPFSQIAGMSEQELADLNASADSGKLPGLVRVRPGMEEFLPSDLKTAVENGNVKPIVAKGFNKDGNLVTYHYYFTEPTIQNEVYNTTDLTDTFDNKFFRNVGTITRTAARMMTTFKPVWNAYNYVRDSFERISIMLMRPVKDRNGNLVNRWDLSKAYFKNLAAISSSLPAQQEIFRYLTLGEVKSKLQRDLHEAVGSGAINLMASQTEKHSVMADIKKSGAEKLTNEAMKMLGVGMNKAGAGKAKQLMEQGLDMYVMRLTEVPQITTALASYLAYKDVGVNQTETANRVRDQYDPLRAGNKYITGASTLFPFVRSTFSGHYNLQRSLTEYWGAGEWQFTAMYAIGATLGSVVLFSAMSGIMGEDDDGVPRMARLPTSTLMSGIPVPTGDDGVWSMPVGFGMNKLFLGIGANIYKQWNGWQDGSDTAKNMLGLVMDNTSPVQMSSSKAFDENPVAAVGLSFVPTVLKPIVELGFNVNSFRGGKIISRDTPRDQYDHLQDNFNVPEDYKNMVTWLHKMSGGAVDMRPETLKYLFDGYGGMTGPFSVIPKAILQDKGEKTMGNAMTKGEYFNPFLVAIGADMAIQPNALNITGHTYAMQDMRYELHKQYGVGETHSKEDYARTADTGPRGGTHSLKAWELTKLKLEEQNAPQEVIDYIVNGMKYNTARKEADGAFKDLADEYYKAKVNGTDTAEMRIALQDAWDNLENLTNEYVMENNRAYYELRK